MKGMLYCALLVFVACLVLTESYPNPRVRYAYENPERFFVPFEDRQSLEEEAYEQNREMDSSANEHPNNFNPLSYGPLASFVQSMQAMMKRVQTQMGEVLSRMPPQDIDWSKLGNTTSHTKVVDNHLVTVNETTYKNSDADSRSVLHIKIVDVKPTSSEGYDDFATSTDATENSQGPETDDIDKDVDRNYQENTDMIKREDSGEYGNHYPGFLDSVDNSVDVFQPMNPVDLSRDTLVNNLMQGQRKGGLFMIDPDAELIDIEDGRVRPVYSHYPPNNYYNQQRSEPQNNYYNQQRSEPIFT